MTEIGEITEEAIVIVIVAIVTEVGHAIDRIDEMIGTADMIATIVTGNSNFPSPLYFVRKLIMTLFVKSFRLYHYIRIVEGQLPILIYVLFSDAIVATELSSNLG